MVALPTVEIPGFREAVKKERTLRDAAFLDGNENLLGIEVVPLSLRRLIWLEQAECGFVCPWRWESDAEIISHAVMLVHYCRPGFRLDNRPRFSWWSVFWQSLAMQRTARSILSRHTPERVVTLVGGWLEDAFMDAPAGSAGISNRSLASYPAYVFDLFGEAGLTYTPDQILDMPLKRLWQHLRVASARMNGTKLTNPSDELAVNHITKHHGVRS